MESVVQKVFMRTESKLVLMLTDLRALRNGSFSFSNRFISAAEICVFLAHDIKFLYHSTSLYELLFSADESGSGMKYVDLTLNPERYTGYAGSAARKIWNSIYKENCFM